MLANAAISAALVFMAGAFWLLAQTTSLASYRAVIVRDYGLIILGFALALYFNLLAAFYLGGRLLFLRRSGQKLTHIDRQLANADTIAEDLSAQLVRHGKQ